MANVDKRSVSTDALETLGTIIGDGAGRDAIHLAVEPVVAATSLFAGEHVGFVSKGKVARYADKLLGIVDPFLKNEVSAGEKFWLVLYPRQITSLRHVWSHPDFPEEHPKKESDYSEATINESKAWIDVYANSLGFTYREMIEGAAEKYLCGGESLEGESVHDAFWDHYEIATGSVIPEDDRTNFFRCAC